MTPIEIMSRFKVNRPINIESFGFFGPFEIGCHGKYHMDIALLTEDYFEIAGTTQVTPVINHGDLFHVKFDSGIPILPCLWYMAKFSLLVIPEFPFLIFQRFDIKFCRVLQRVKV